MMLGARALRAAVSIGLLCGLVWWVDAGGVVSRLAGMRLEWVLAAVALSVAQVVVLAWRWRYTAVRLGVSLTFASAWREYYLSIFLNQVLPGGVLGDVSRAWRHSRAQTRLEERNISNNRRVPMAVMSAVAVVSLLTLPITVGVGSRRVLVGASAAAVVIALVSVVWIRRQSTSSSLSGRVLADLIRAHRAGGVIAAQIASAVLVVATYLATFLVAARAIGVETSMAALLPLVAPVLMTMLIPVTVAGWGLREGAAALLWGAVGLTAADGVAVSVTYGVMVLIGSLPGAVFLLRDWSARPVWAVDR